MQTEYLIKKYEGCKLRAYKCPKGIWTIGWGSTFYEDGRPVKEGDVISQEKADYLLNHYIATYIYTVVNLMKKKFTNEQKAALYSLIYNWGPDGFRKSKLYQAIKNDDYAEICRQWDFGFKNNLKGLFKRRTEELYLFIKDV